MPRNTSKGMLPYTLPNRKDIFSQFISSHQYTSTRKLHNIHLILSLTFPFSYRKEVIQIMQG